MGTFNIISGGYRPPTAELRSIDKRGLTPRKNTTQAHRRKNRP